MNDVHRHGLFATHSDWFPPTWMGSHPKAVVSMHIDSLPPTWIGIRAAWHEHRIGYRVGTDASPDSEEICRLFAARPGLALLLAVAPGTPLYKAVVDMAQLLLDLYHTYQMGPPPQCQAIAATFREHCAPGSTSHYLLLLEEDADRLLAAVKVDTQLWASPFPAYLRENSLRVMREGGGCPGYSRVMQMPSPHGSSLVCFSLIEHPEYIFLEDKGHPRDSTVVSDHTQVGCGYNCGLFRARKGGDVLLQRCYIQVK